MEGRKISNVGFEIESFEQSTLPRIKDVLCVFFFHHRTEHKTVRESARITIKKVQTMWSSVQVPLSQEIRNIERIEKLFMEWKALSKTNFRVSNKFLAFIAKLDQLFDISTRDAIQRVEAEIAAGPSVERKRTLENSLEYYREQSKPRALRSKIFKPSLVDEEEVSMEDQPQLVDEDDQSLGMFSMQLDIFRYIDKSFLKILWKT